MREAAREPSEEAVTDPSKEGASNQGSADADPRRAGDCLPGDRKGGMDLRVDLTRLVGLICRGWCPRLRKANRSRSIARRFIDREAARPAFGAESLCAQFGPSRSMLYREFGRRAARAVELLTRPDAVGLTTAAVTRAIRRDGVGPKTTDEVSAAAIGRLFDDLWQAGGARSGAAPEDAAGAPAFLLTPERPDRRPSLSDHVPGPTGPSPFRRRGASAGFTAGRAGPRPCRRRGCPRSGIPRCRRWRG